MRLRIRCLSALLALSSPALGSAAPAPATEVTVSEPPQAKPPPGTKQDQEIWRSGWDAQTGCLIESETARGLLNEIRSAKLYDRLATIAKSGRPDAAKTAEELTRRLATSADVAYEAASKRPFDLRTGCRYQIVRMREAMEAPAGSSLAAELPAARANLVTCRDTLHAYLKPLAAANEGLDASMREVRSCLATREPKDADAASVTASEKAAPPAAAR